MGNENKVEYNLKQVHYAVIAEDGTYGAPVHMTGAVHLYLKVKTKTVRTHVDGVEEIVQLPEDGYVGEIEMARIPNQFKQDIFGDSVDSKGALIENVYGQKKQFALLFEYEGDASEQRIVLYRCMAERPEVETRTDEDGKHSYKTDVMPIKAMPLNDGKLKASMDGTADATAYNNWYKKVYE